MISVILLMAGKGSRMGYEKNKILLPFGKKMLYEFPLSLFLNRGYEVICVISHEDETELVPHLSELPVKYTFGGATRGESVYNGLRMATGDYVMIHDAARMWIKDSVLDEIEAVSELKYPVLCYFPVKDTIKLKEEGKLLTLKRSDLIAASTPQCAERSLFLDVYERASSEGYQGTDDVSLIEKYHPDVDIRLVQSNEEAFKVTTPMDYRLAKMIWEEEK